LCVRLLRTDAPPLPAPGSLPALSTLVAGGRASPTLPHALADILYAEFHFANWDCL
jgi:hypothetical protein